MDHLMKWVLSMLQGRLSLVAATLILKMLKKS